MQHPTTLLLCSHPALIMAVQQAHDAWTDSRLEVSGRIEKVNARAGCGDIVLTVLHVNVAGDRAAVAGLFRQAESRPNQVVVVMHEDERLSEEAATLSRDCGARLLVLPRDTAALAELLRSAQQARRPPRQRPAPPPALGDARDGDLPLFGDSQELDEIIKRVAPQDTTVLLLGETGTGKTRLARQIHELSPRRGSPFLVMDCGALSPNLIESELFGHVKGAFSGAERDREGKFLAAGRGTLVLDEINSLPLALQSKLLRAVEERVFEPVGANHPIALEARLVAISNVSLEEAVRQGRFRADLLYRLNVVSLQLPPLRACAPSIAPLARQFIHQFSAQQRRTLSGIAPDAMTALEAYDWPGNVRELRNVVERAVVLTGGPVIRLRDLPEAVRAPRTRFTTLAPTGAYGSPHPPAVATPAQDEPGRIREALLKHRNNRARAAAELGISRVSLYKKLHKFGLFAVRGSESVADETGSRAR